MFQSVGLPPGFPEVSCVSMSTTVFCYQLFKDPSHHGRCLVAKAAGGKAFYQEEKQAVLSPFFSSPKSLFLAASPYSCCHKPCFATAQVGRTGLNLMCSSGLQNPGSPNMVPLGVLERREPGTYSLGNPDVVIMYCLFAVVFYGTKIPLSAR